MGSQKKLSVPILFLIFNRPNTTKQVFQAIREVKPSRLYIAADAPRYGIPGESSKCEKARKIATKVDWDCKVNTLFRDENLGCKRAVSSAIDWFFENEEMGIILEDDCLPSHSFFWFCEELLNRYREDDQIFIISGYNKQQEWNPNKYDYFFSNLGGIWGWASWRRAWTHYDGEMNGLEKIATAGFFERRLGKKLGKIRYEQLLDAKKKNALGQIDSWAFPWAYSRHLKNGLACVPSVSLIENIGFGEGATHTGSDPDNVKKQEINLPLRYNDIVVPDFSYDYKFIASKPFIVRLFQRIKKMISQFISY